MTRARFAALLVCCALLACATAAQALSCPMKVFDETQAKRLFAHSEAVFVGRLEAFRVAEHRFNQRLEPQIAPPDIEVAPAVFAVKRAYKGAQGVALEVYVEPNLAPGKEYLVFASTVASDSGSAPGELVAADNCEQQTFDVRERDTAGPLLAYLDALPMEGSGGEMSVRLLSPLDKRPRADVALDFESDGNTVSLRTDAQGMALARNVRAGSYRLITAAPEGFRYKCSGAAGCDALVVHDRGLDEFWIEPQARAELDVQVVDAGGHPADVIAQFDLFEPGSGRRIGTLEHARFDYSCPKHACAAYGPLPPGKIALGLVLPRVGPLDGVGAESIGAPSVIFENGGGDPSTAPVIDVHEGKNVRVFRLPAALLPVRTQFIAPQDLTVIPALLVDEQAATRDLGTLDYDFAESARRVLWSIPGQTFVLRIFEDKRSETEMLRPLADAEVPLGSTAGTSNEKGRP